MIWSKIYPKTANLRKYSFISQTKTDTVGVNKSTTEYDQ